MTLFELDQPHDIPTSGARSGLMQWLGKAMRAMQYARMLQAMSELSDAQLEAIGISRADIPRIAREAIYDSHA